MCARTYSGSLSLSLQNPQILATTECVRQASADLAPRGWDRQLFQGRHGDFQNLERFDSGQQTLQPSGLSTETTARISPRRCF